MQIYSEQAWFLDKLENITHDKFDNINHDKFENITHDKLKILIMSSADTPILTSKPSVTNVSRFQCFEDFDIKFLLSGQNSFE